MRTARLLLSVVAAVLVCAGLAPVAQGQDVDCRPSSEHGQGGLSHGPRCSGFEGGRQGYPLPRPGEGVIAGFRLNSNGLLVQTPCSGGSTSGWAQQHAAAPFGIPVHYYFVWGTNAQGHAQPMVLVCSLEGAGRVDSGTIGPYPARSTPCPHLGHDQSRPYLGGAGWTVSHRVHRTRNWVVSEHPQASGSFGFGNDGYWSYQIFAATEPASLQLYGYCTYRLA